MVSTFLASGSEAVTSTFMVSVVRISVLLGRNLQSDLDALDRMVVDSLVGSGDAMGSEEGNEGNDESMVEEIESQV